MFSTDQNVEKLADLMVLMKDYLRLQSNYLQLTATEKAIRILSLIVLSITLWFSLLLALLFLSFAAVHWISDYFGQTMAVSYLIVGVVHLFLFVTIYLKRHSWIEKPLVKRFANILMSKKHNRRGGGL